MAKTRLPDVSFEKGICLQRTIPGIPCARDRSFWFVIGKYGNDLFMIGYSNGYTNWYADIRLKDNDRAKILNQFREELREATPLPSYITEYDLRAADVADLKLSDVNAGNISSSFYDDVWLKQYQGIEYIILDVPFHEKDAAHQAGAVWNAGLKKWQAVKDHNMDKFKRWLPQPEMTTDSQS